MRSGEPKVLVFVKERLAFLSVPKTGTTAYQAALADRADMVVSDPPMLKHAPVYRYNRFFRPMFEKVCGVELELMAVMREPVSWLGSWYRYRQRPFMAGKPNSTAGISFDDFVLGYLKGKKPGFADVGSQANFLKSQPNGTGISHLFRYEDQDRLQAFLQDRLEVRIDLQQLNVSPPMQLHLSTSVEDRLRRKCAEEFLLYDSIS
nr:gamma-glutamyl kinase [Sulfitobacter mediterraneus]